ncbi:hypothetical protein LOK49_LG07G02578 [Camellia lanceoleosa]|uniref:Uncharacterized protein n=1 Tax=Camellia lanceoleosa TaxID=1840588 RepID=A0ACC0H889_9ERIC|nr:hypothetical protein LOK49_LG07G02578 [Camellia lanceoleosa]
MLENIPGVSPDDDLYVWAARLFLRDKRRECFMSLPTDEVRLKFLKLEIEMEKATTKRHGLDLLLSPHLSLLSKPVSSSSPALSSPSISNQCRSFSFSSAFRNLRCSVPRWSHGVDWNSPASLTAQIRTASPLIGRFERKIATMASENAFKGILTSLPKAGGGEFGKFYSLPALNDPRIDKLPYSIRILLESAIRNCDNFQVTKDDVEKIIDWENTSPKQVEIPFKPARVLLQDFTGVPAVVDLACMRDAMNKLGSDSNKINPLVPVDLVIDHSVQVDVTRSENAVQANMELELQRNKERFAFLKWGRVLFTTCLLFLQVLVLFISVVGTDSHTTMIDGLGVAGWGVGGIEAEAVMLGQPMSMVLPGVVGFKLSGKLNDGVTATDLVLTVTQMLRKHGVVGKFVEFYGEGGKISLADRATIANMSPEYGATMGFFPVDKVTLQYLKLTGRSDETHIYANNMFVDYNEPQQQRAYSSYIELDLANVEPCVSGPKRPHDRVPLKEMKADWHSCLDNKVGFKGFAVPKEAQDKVGKFSFHGQPAELRHGSVACELGLQVKPWVKTSLAPGSGVVTKYLLKSGLQKYFNEQGFHIVGYGCTTCIGNSGDLDESVASAISENDIVAAGSFWEPNFEGRVHALTRANYLASPPLVVAYALAGTVDIDFDKEPIGVGKDGKNVYFRDIWPSTEEIAEVVQTSVLPDMFKSTYEAITTGNPMWNQLSIPESKLYSWDPNSTYIHEPPYFKNMTMDPPGPSGVKDAYCILNFGDSITTDHISPAGSIHKDSPGAKFLLERGVERKDFNSYGSRRGNDEVMARGTFANIRIVNKLLNGEVGPKTIHIPTGEKLYVFDAATGVKAVIAKSFERIHRSNLVGMGIIPLCFKAGEDADSLGLTGHERYTIDLASKISEIKPGQDVTVKTDTGKSFTCTARFDTEYGATMGFFPVDKVTLQYLKLTGRSDETVAMIEAYLRANNMFVDYNEPQQQRAYSSYIELDLANVEPCVSGPKRPHDRVPLKEMKADWHSCLDNKVGFKVDIDFDKEPIGVGKDGKNVYFSDIWPSMEEIAELSIPESKLYSWDPNSTYIHEPPYFKNMTMDPPGPSGVKDAYCILNFGDSITTDHISPAGSIHKDSPGAKFLLERGVEPKDFNSYVSRRGNDEVMARGTFANIRISYHTAGQDTIVLAVAEYGSGCSRDWAAKGVKAEIAKSFERIHRSNLVGMGIIPLCFKAGEDADSLGLTGHGGIPLTSQAKLVRLSLVKMLLSRPTPENLLPALLALILS